MYKRQAHVAQTSITADEIAPVSSGQLASDDALLDESALIGLTTIQLSPEDIEDNVDEQVATDVAIRSMDEISAQNRTDLRGLVESENLYATATSVAQTSLSTKAKIDSQRLLAKEKKENSIFAHDKFQNDRIESIADASDEAAELAGKIAKRNVLWDDINKNSDKLLAQQEFMDNLPGKEDIVTSTYTPGVTNQSQFEKTNQRAVEVSKQAEQDAQNKTTKVDMETTIGELAAERKAKAIIAQNAADNEAYLTSDSSLATSQAEARKKQMSKLAAQEAQFKASNAITSKMDRDNICLLYTSPSPRD